MRFAEVLLSTALATSLQLAVIRAADAGVKLETPRATAIFSICSAAPLRLLQQETASLQISTPPLPQDAASLWPFQPPGLTRSNDYRR